jgi:hypothetical protein
MPKRKLRKKMPPNQALSRAKVSALRSRLKPKKFSGTSGLDYWIVPPSVMDLTLKGAWKPELLQAMSTKYADETGKVDLTQEQILSEMELLGPMIDVMMISSCVYPKIYPNPEERYEFVELEDGDFEMVAVHPSDPTGVFLYQVPDADKLLLLGGFLEDISNIGKFPGK